MTEIANNRFEQLLELWKKIDQKYKYSRNQSVFRNGWVLGKFIGNPELNTICQNKNISEFIELVYSYKDLSKTEFTERFNQLHKNLDEYQVVNFNEYFPSSNVNESVVNRSESISEIKNIINKNPHSTFFATGYAPAESEEDDVTGDGHYWTEWEELSGEELINKLEDKNYQLDNWICNELSEEVNNGSNNKLNSNKEYISKLENLLHESKINNELLKQSLIENKKTIDQLITKVNNSNKEAMRLINENKKIAKENHELKDKLKILDKQNLTV